MSYFLHPEINAVLNPLLALWREVLQDNLVGAYLRGSLALGGYEPGKSDLDFLVVLQTPLTDGQLGALQHWHGLYQQQDARPHLEGYYIDHESLCRLDFRAPIHGGLNTEYNLRRESLKSNAILECWIVRKCPVVLLGPDPRTLIPEVGPEQVRAAVRSILHNWSTPQDFMDWLELRGAQAYAIQTLCRALHSLVTGEVTSKPEALQWAHQHLPQDRALLEWSVQNRAAAGKDLQNLPRVLDLIARVTGCQDPLELLQS